MGTAPSKRERLKEEETASMSSIDLVEGAMSSVPTQNDPRMEPQIVNKTCSIVDPVCTIDYLHPDTSATIDVAPVAVSPPPSPSALNGKEGVCLIEVVSVAWIWTHPWQCTDQLRSAGSGFIVRRNQDDKHYILTNAHVVASAIDIRVRLHGVSRRFRAQVSVYAPDVDLALLELDDKKEQYDFFGSKNSSSPALELATDLPALQERVHVMGYPKGGLTICVTEGVVSRIDNLDLGHDTVLSIQIDAAINAGNSGGPVFDSRGFVTGVAFCKANSPGTDNVGYVLPADVVRAFLGRCHADGSYSFSPSVPYRWHALENKSLRLYHDVPDDIHGVLLTDVAETVKGALQKNDVLTSIDGHAIADDGQFVLRGDEMMQHCNLLRGKHIDQNTTFTVYRNSKLIASKPCVLSYIPDICPRWPDVDHLPNYLIVGALVFLPLTHHLVTKKDSGTRLQATYFDWIQRWPEDWDDGIEELVVLTNIFAHDVSFSYRRKWRRVLKYNGMTVTSLRHLCGMWEVSSREAREEANTKRDLKAFVRIELEYDDDIVLEVHAAMRAQAEILATHQISNPSQSNPPNSKYRLS